MTVLKTIDKAALQDLKDNATKFYNGGFCDECAIPVIRTTVSQVAVMALGILATFQRRDELLAAGYTPSDVTPQQHGAYITFYVKKPQAEQKADLKAIHARVEASYRAAIERDNELIVTRQVELELAAAQRRDDEVQASELKAQRAEMEERIRAELSR